MRRKDKKDEGTIHNNLAEPIILDKVNKKKKEKKFNIEDIFDHNYKPGKQVEMGKKEKDKVRDKLAFSFLTREQGRIANSYKKVQPFG